VAKRKPRPDSPPGTGRTKRDIAKRIADEFGLSQQMTAEIVQRIFDSILEAIVLDDRIELRNFGVFHVKRRAARKARNPRTGEVIDVPARLSVAFRAGKEMEARVRELGLRERGQRDGSPGQKPEGG
jgi:integration host factor subunit beta